MDYLEDYGPDRWNRGGVNRYQALDVITLERCAKSAKAVGSARMAERSSAHGWPSARSFQCRWRTSAEGSEQHVRPDRDWIPSTEGAPADVIAAIASSLGKMDTRSLRWTLSPPAPLAGGEMPFKPLEFRTDISARTGEFADLRRSSAVHTCRKSDSPSAWR